MHRTRRSQTTHAFTRAGRPRHMASGRLFSHAWISSPSHVNSLISSPSPEMKGRWEIFSLASSTGSAMSRRKCVSKANAAMFTRPRLSSHSRRLSFQRTWTQCRHSFAHPKTGAGFMDAALATPRESLPRKSRLLKRCAAKVSALGCFSSLAKNVTALAQTANQQANGCKFLINGEPTENRVATASKGALRVELTARGRMAHSAYPELGESAIDKLLEALSGLRAMRLPEAEGIGSTTLNIGLIEGGRAPNVIADKARAQLLYRLIGPSDQLKREILQAVGDLAQVDFVLEIPFVRLRTLDGLPTMIAAFTTDIPALSNWGEPLLVGPGSIHVAHAEGEYVEKEQLDRKSG